jgi:hypothetical protein
MADLDDETLERVKRWCAEAGRAVAKAEIRSALARLSWDDLLNVRALLADPPPARPLGPAALADLARGTPADLAAEREREGRYRSEGELAGPKDVAAPEPAPPAAPRRSRAGKRRPAPPVIHRKRDSAPPPPPLSPAPRTLKDLWLPPGRALLGQLIRKQGARRPFLLAALAGWRRLDGGSPDDADLSALLDHHGLARSFAHRERDELLHALRASRGDLAAASLRAGFSREGYQAALDRLGGAADAERIRDERRAELRARATLAERCRLIAEDAEQIADLGLLAEIEEDLRARLPEHLRAVRAGGSAGSLPEALARSLALPEPAAFALARRLGLDLGATAPPRRPERADADRQRRRPGGRPDRHSDRRRDAPRGQRTAPPRKGRGAGKPRDPRRRGKV